MVDSLHSPLVSSLSVACNSRGIVCSSDQSSGPNLLEFIWPGATSRCVLCFVISENVAKNIQSFNIDDKNEWGETALHIAARAGNAEMVKLLVQEGGANVETSDRKNRTPLMIAKARGNDEIVKLLQQYVKPPLV